MRSAVAVLMFVTWDVTACSFARQSEVEIAPHQQPKTETRPDVPTVTVGLIRRGRAPDGVWNWSCDDTGLVSIRMPLNENTKDLIFAFRVLSGTTDELKFRDGYYAGFTREGASSMSFTFPWIDGASDQQEPLDFVLEIIPARRSGLIGRSKIIRISYPIK